MEDQLFQFAYDLLRANIAPNDTYSYVVELAQMLSIPAREKILSGPIPFEEIKADAMIQSATAMVRATLLVKEKAQCNQTTV